MANPTYYLFHEGDKCTSITGGWLFGKLGVTNNGGNGSFSTNGGDGCMLFSAASTSGMNARRMNYLTTNKVDTTGFNYLCIDWHSAQYNTSDATMSVGLYASNTVKELGYKVKGTWQANSYLTRQINKLDISSYQGEYYVGGYFFKAADTSNTYTGRIFNIWLE